MLVSIFKLHEYNDQHLQVMHLAFQVALYLPYGYKIDVSKISKFLASCSFTIILKVSCFKLFYNYFEGFLHHARLQLF
jgi:hypothetical protein